MLGDRSNIDLDVITEKNSPNLCINIQDSFSSANKSDNEYEYQNQVPILQQIPKVLPRKIFLKILLQMLYSVLIIQIQSKNFLVIL